METTIDRTSYRRSNIKCEVKERKKTKLVKIFYNEIIAAMSILVAVLIIKLFDLKTASDWIKQNIETGTPYETLALNVKEKARKIVNNFSKINESGEAFENKFDESNLEVKVNENNLIDSSGENTVFEYESAVEGINQLSEDAKYIKENYKLLMPLKGTITSKFGCRVDNNPIVSNYHTGLDIAANTGTTISSALDGTVTEAGNISGYGKCVMIKKDEVLIVYAHCSKINVKKGQKIKQGDKIGEVGMTGNATGPHLHLEIRYDGRYVNPEDIFECQ